MSTPMCTGSNKLKFPGILLWIKVQAGSEPWKSTQYVSGIVWQNAEYSTVITDSQTDSQNAVEDQSNAPYKKEIKTAQ